MKKVLKKAGSVFLAAALSSSVAAVSVTTVSAFESLPDGFNKNDLAEHTMGIVGEFNRWSEDIAKMTDDDGDGVYLGVVEDVQPGEYEFKVRLDGEWDYSWGACEDDTFNSQTNCWINVNTVSDIVVVMDTNGEDGNMWSVNYFALSDEGGDSSVFNASEHTFGVIGSFNDWNEDVEMTEISDGIYCANIGDVEANKEFMIRADGEWDWSWGAYEAEEDRTINSQTSMVVAENTKNVTVVFNTNGSDYRIWHISFFYTEADGFVKYVNGTTLEGETSNGLKWKENEDGSIAITNYTGESRDVVIPDKIRGKTVAEIGEWAFSDCTGLISVSIPDSVKSIGDGAFSGCTGLTSVDIPDSVKFIGEWAFSDCTGLISVIIPGSVTEIGYWAFSGCTGLKSVTIPDSVTEIGEWAFGYYWDEDADEYLLTDLIIFGKISSAAEEYANENSIPFVAMDKELSDTEKNITVTGDIGENTKLEVSELKPEDAKISGKKTCAYYDISLTKNGENVQPDGNVTVKIPYKGDSENIEVYRINDDGTTEKMQSSYDGEYVTFITDHFSKYAIVEDAGIKGDTNNDGEVNIADALMISRYDAGMAELDGSQLAVSDVNGDGEVNIADALMISRFDAGLIDKL